MGILDKDHQSPMDPPRPKTQEEREQAALKKAMEDDRKNLTSAVALRMKEIEKQLSAMRPVVDELRTLRGAWPMKVTGDIVSIDPVALAGGQGGRDQIIDAIVVVNGFPFYATIDGVVGAAVAI